MTREERDWNVWIACLVDTEGHIGLHVYGPRDSGGNRASGTFHPMISVTNCCYDVMLEVHQKYGGYLKQKWRLPNPNHRPCYAIEWRGARSVRRLLAIVMPYMKIKRKQAETMLEVLQDPAFQSQRFIAKKFGVDRITSPDVWDRRKHLANSVNSFNQAWRKPTPSEAPEAVSEADDGERVTAVYEAREGRDSLLSQATAS